MPVTYRDALFALIVLSPFILAWLADVVTGGAVSAAARGAAGHARAQAASEVRRTRQAVVDNTRAGLRKRIEDGKARGPKSAIWWGAAAVASARKVHRSLKGLRDGATGKASSSLPSAGPWRRIRDAAVAGAGARYRDARDAAKARRAAGPTLGERARQARRNANAWHRPASEPAPTGTCDGCGVMAARTALAPDGPWLLCAGCRGPAVPDDTGTADALPAGAGAAEGDEAIDGELVPVPALTAAAPSITNTTRNGELMAGQGALARRTAQPAHRAAAVAGRGGGDIANHGDWDRGTQQVGAALELIIRHQEAMLQNLRAEDAGRTQMADIRVWSDRVSGAVAFIRSMLTETNGRIYPLIDAVDAAGGPCEVASPAYHSDY